jgi:hypothetical protein
MKGIIAEIDGSKMIVIAKNGDFIKCKKLPNFNIGDEVNIPMVNMATVYKRMSVVAASFLIFAMLSTGVYAYYTPYSYVSVDINPSLELSVNRFEKVIGAHAFNEDAKKVLGAASDIKNKSVDAALAQIINTASDQGYLQPETSNNVMIVVSSSSNKEEAALAVKVSKASTEALSHLSSNYEVILEKTQMDNYKKAQKKNISPGRVILASEFKEVKPDIDEDQIIRMPLQQAIKQIEKKDDSVGNPNKPDKPKAEPTAQNNKPQISKVKVKNVKEFIMEKNEDLGKKFTEQNNGDGNGNSNGNGKNGKDKENFNNGNNGNGNDNNKDKQADDSDKGNGNKQQQDNKGGKKN